MSDDDLAAPLDALLVDARRHVVPGGGHLFPLERPAGLAALVTRGS